MSSSNPIQITDRQSNFQIFKSISSNAISSLSGSMFAYGVGLMLLYTTHSPLSFGLDILISPLISLLFFIPIGNLVDRHNHKRILIFTYIVRLIALVLFAMTIDQFNGIGKLIPVAIFITIDSFLNNFRSTAYSASVHELVNDKKIAPLSSFTQACSAGTQILGPIFGILLYTLIGIEGFVQIEIVATVIAFGILLTMKFFVKDEHKGDAKKTKKTEASQWQDFKVGVQYMNKRALIKDLIILAAVLNLLFTVIPIGMPLIVTNQLHFPNGTIAVLETGFSIGVLIGSIGANIIQKKGSLVAKIFIPLFIASIGLLALGFVLYVASSVAMVNILGILSMITIAVSVAIVNVSLGVRLQTTIPTELLGRVSSTLRTATSISMPIGTLIFTLLFDVIKTGSYVLIASGIITIIYVLICTPIFIKNIRQDDQYLVKEETVNE